MFIPLLLYIMFIPMFCSLDVIIPLAPIVDYALHLTKIWISICEGIIDEEFRMGSAFMSR